MGRALLQLLLGGPILAFSLLFLYDSERQVVEQERYLSVGQALAVSTSAERVTPGLEGQLIHLSAQAVAPGEAGVLRDPMLGVTVEGLRLKRQVYMYQWQERAERQQHRSGNTTRTTTVYHYERVWAPDRIDSKSFQKRVEHENPPLRLRSETFDSPRVRVGAYELSRPFVWLLEHWTTVNLDVSMLEQRSPELGASVHLQDATTVFVGKNPSDPWLGDLRISYRVVPSTTVTVVGRQVGDHIEHYLDPRTSRAIGMVLYGEQPLESLFTRLQGSNQDSAWPARLGGCVPVFISLLFLVGLLSAVTGPLSGWKVLGASLLLCLPVAVLPMGWAWYGFKPGGGVGLMGAGVMGLCGALALTRRWARA